MRVTIELPLTSNKIHVVLATRVLRFAVFILIIPSANYELVLVHMLSGVDAVKLNFQSIKSAR